MWVGAHEWRCSQRSEVSDLLCNRVLETVFWINSKCSQPPSLLSSPQHFFPVANANKKEEENLSILYSQIQNKQKQLSLKDFAPQLLRIKATGEFLQDWRLWVPLGCGCGISISKERQQEVMYALLKATNERHYGLTLFPSFICRRVNPQVHIWSRSGTLEND